MTAIRFLSGHDETKVAGSSRIAGVAVYASRLAAHWRERSRLTQIEALPEDIRKDIGWPTGSSTR